MSAAPASTTTFNSLSRALIVLVYALVLLAIAYFAWRGVWRGVMDSGDFAVGYSAGRAWVAGFDPYDVDVLEHQMVLADGADLAGSGLLDQLQNVYFPGTLPAFALFAAASWPIAKLLFVTVNVAGSVFIALGLQRLLGWAPSRLRALGFLGFFLALAPVHTTIASGQASVVAVACIVAGLLLGRSGRSVLSGVAYGLATVVKVQIGLPFIAYLLWRRRWMSAALAGAMVVGFSVLAVLRMEIAGVAWINSWLGNLRTLSGPGGMNDSSLLNPERYSLVNLQYLLFTLLPSGGWIDLLTLALVGALGLILVALVDWRDRDELLPVSVVAVLALLVAYHRYYDAVLLAFPLAWGIASIGRRRWPEGLLVLVLSVDFLFPFQTAIHELQQDGVVPSWLTDRPLWAWVVLTQHVWALVLMVIVLLVAAARNRRAGGPAPPIGAGGIERFTRLRFRRQRESDVGEALGGRHVRPSGDLDDGR